MKKTLLLLLTVAIFQSTIVNAQFEFPKQEKAVEFKKRPLIVELQEESSEQVKKLSKKPDQLKSYREYIAYYNDLVKEYVVNNYWKLNDNIQFKKTSEIDALIKNGNEGYSLFMSTWSLKDQRTNNNVITVYDVYSFAGFLIEDAKKRNDGKYMNGEVFSVSLPSDQLLPGDLIFVMEEFNNYVDVASKGGKKADLYNIDSNLTVIKTKTLLIDKESVKSTKEEISKAYPYPFEIVSRDEIEKAIKEKNDKYYYINLIWSDAHKYYLFIAPDASNGKLLSKMGTGGFNGVGFGGVFGSVSYSSSLLVSDEIVGIIINKTAQKFNNFKK